MASNTLSLYIKSPLFEKVRLAHDDPDRDFDYRKICVEALERALDPQQPSEVPGSAGATDLTELARLAAEIPPEEAEYEYDISAVDNMTAAKAFLDNMVANGGYPVSMDIDPAGRVVFLAAWPKTPVPAQ